MILYRHSFTSLSYSLPSRYSITVAKNNLALTFNDGVRLVPIVTAILGESLCIQFPCLSQMSTYCLRLSIHCEFHISLIE